MGSHRGREKAFGVVVEGDVAVGMWDGTVLRADVYRPSRVVLPVIR